MQREREHYEAMRAGIIDEVEQERQAQDSRWGGPGFDDLHGSYDWLAFLMHDIGRAVVWPFDASVFRRQMLSAAAIALAAVEWVDRAHERDAKPIVDLTSGEGNLGDTG